MAPVYIKYTFPPAGSTDICLSQNALAGTNLVINGALATNTGTASFIANGYCRGLSFYSPNNLSSVTITIAGVQNGQYVTETISGPNNNTITSFNYYDIVYSINVNANVTALSVGSGFTGYFKIIPIDLTRSNTNYAMTIASLAATNQYNTVIWSTLDNINNTGYSYNSILASNVGTLNTVKSLSTNGNLYTLPSNPLVNYYLIQVSGPSTVAANGLTLIFIQT